MVRRIGLQQAKQGGDDVPRKRRRSTFAGTSGSGSLARDPVTGPGPPVALRAPSAPGPVIGSISTTSGMRGISPTFPAPTLISSGMLSHRLLGLSGFPNAILGPFGVFRG